MSTQTTPLPPDAKAPAEATAEHHPRPAPEEHLCTCGKLREDCVRDTVRTMWEG